jgi:hypothetical protein
MPATLLDSRSPTWISNPLYSPAHARTLLHVPASQIRSVDFFLFTKYSIAGKKWRTSTLPTAHTKGSKTKLSLSLVSVHGVT